MSQHSPLGRALAGTYERRKAQRLARLSGLTTLPIQINFQVRCDGLLSRGRAELLIRDLQSCLEALDESARTKAKP